MDLALCESFQLVCCKEKCPVIMTVDSDLIPTPMSCMVDTGTGTKMESLCDGAKGSLTNSTQNYNEGPSAITCLRTFKTTPVIINNECRAQHLSSKLKINKHVNSIAVQLKRHFEQTTLMRGIMAVLDQIVGYQ